MKKVSIIWLITAIVLPCCLNLNRLGCCLFAVENLAAAVFFARRHAPELWS